MNFSNLSMALLHLLLLDKLIHLMVLFCTHSSQFAHLELLSDFTASMFICSEKSLRVNRIHHHRSAHWSINLFISALTPGWSQRKWASAKNASSASPSSSELSRLDWTSCALCGGTGDNRSNCKCTCPEHDTFLWPVWCVPQNRVPLRGQTSVHTMPPGHWENICLQLLPGYQTLSDKMLEALISEQYKVDRARKNLSGRMKKWKCSHCKLGSGLAPEKALDGKKNLN